MVIPVDVPSKSLLEKQQLKSIANPGGTFWRHISEARYRFFPEELSDRPNKFRGVFREIRK
jgi:hypothetical protein